MPPTTFSSNLISGEKIFLFTSSRDITTRKLQKTLSAANPRPDISHGFYHIILG